MKMKVESRLSPSASFESDLLMPWPSSMVIPDVSASETSSVFTKRDALSSSRSRSAISRRMGSCA